MRFHTKGAITVAHLVGWGITVALASAGYTSLNFNKLADANTQMVQRVSVVETKSTTYQDSIDSLSAKVDKLNVNVAQLLYAQGIRPK